MARLMILTSLTTSVNIENNFCIGFYFSSSRDDVDVNYDSTEGVDLLNRIDQMAERLMSEDDDLSLFQATRIATDELSGQENRIIEVVLSVQNPMMDMTRMKYLKGGQV